MGLLNHAAHAFVKDYPPPNFEGEYWEDEDGKFYRDYENSSSDAKVYDMKSALHGDGTFIELRPIVVGGYDKNTQLADAFNIGLGAKGATLGLAQCSKLATNLGRLTGAASVGITVYSKWDRLQKGTMTTMDWVDIGVASGALIGSIAFPPAAVYIGVGAFIYGTIRFYHDYN